jgi:hypothetical protein
MTWREFTKIRNPYKILVATPGTDHPEEIAVDEWLTLKLILY